MAFEGYDGYDTVMDRLERAEVLRENLTLTAQDVADLLDGLTNSDLDAAEEQRTKLATVDVKALRITKKAQQAIADALGLDAEELWP